MIDRWIDAIIADWPLYLVAAIVYALCLLAVRVGFYLIRAERAAFKQKLAALREEKAIEAGRKLYEQAAQDRRD